MDRHDIHVCIRTVIAGWNARPRVMHKGHEIDLAAALTEAVHELINITTVIRSPQNEDN